jgi:hypothetical protein
MRKGIAHLLLVAALVSSGAAAPFLHVHAHGPGHPASSPGGAVDEHCAHHHAAGAHWHPVETPSSVPCGPRAAAPGHRHDAVALSTAAIETSTAGPVAPTARVQTPATVARPVECGMRRPVDPTAGPDPPLRTLDPARAPPARA